MTTSASGAITEQTVRDLSRLRDEPEWLRTRRVEAWRAFETMAMPTGLEEEWRRTDLSGFDLDAALSRFRPEQSLGGAAFEAPPYAGLVVMSLAEAVKTHEALVREHLHSLVLPSEWKLQALQAALWSGGTVVYVPRGLEVDVPINLRLTGDGASPLFPHLLVIAEEDSSITLIQEDESDDRGEQALISAAVEVIQRSNSRVRLFDIQRWGSNAYSFSTTRAKLAQGAHFLACNVGLGGRLTKARIEAILEGEGSQADLIGLSFGSERQHFDYNTLQDHIAAKTTSDLLYKAALTGRASEVWYGTVRIHGGATASDANQTSRNLLLSETAKAAPIPVLEIEQYDILRCSHGATAGPVDEEQLFYLESRGIEHDEAERMLVDAFFQEVLDRIPDEALRERVQEALAAKLEAAA
jgi:Fe-S cluster assembly protein SufD